MLGLLDADILPYEFGAAKDEDGEDLSLNLTIARVYERIDKIQERSQVDKTDFYMTGKGNFREKIATIKPYKGNRPKEKSKHWAAIRHELKTNCDATVVEGMEADDAVSIEQHKDYSDVVNNIETVISSYPKNMQKEIRVREYGHLPDLLDTIIQSRDKDLHIRPGWHYGWEAGNCKEKPLWFQTEVGGLRCFYKQLLTGDSVDNILGLFNVGVKSKLVTDISSMDSEYDMYTHVRSKYLDRFGSYADQFLIENGRLLWMLEYEGQAWVPPIDTQANKQEG